MSIDAKKKEEGSKILNVFKLKFNILYRHLKSSLQFKSNNKKLLKEKIQMVII